MERSLSATPERRGGLSFGALSLASLGLALAVVATATGLYLRYVRYEPVALGHTLPGAVAVVRLDVRAALLYEPFRRRLLPLLGGPEGAAGEGEARLARIEDGSGLHRGDLREVVVSVGPVPGDFLLVLGGIFPADPDGEALALAVKRESPRWASRGPAIAHALRGVAVARSPDGAVLVGSAPELLTSAHRIPGDDALAAGSGGFLVEGGALVETLERAGASPALVGALRPVRRVTGVASLGEEIVLEVRFAAEPRSAASPAAAAVLANLRELSPGSPGVRSLRAAASRGRIAEGQTGEAALVLSWDREELDQAFAAVAEAIRRGFPRLFEASLG